MAFPANSSQKIDLEAGEKKIPRIYDVDESMSLQRMTRKAPAARNHTQQISNKQDYLMLDQQ